MNNRRVTIKEVAKLAGVSTATVSHVINKTRHVEESTIQSVLQAMEELRYRPNILARGLRSGQTKTIGLIVPDASNLFFADIAKRIENIGFDNGYSVILCNSDNDLQKQKLYIQTLIEKQIDGAIFISAGESTDDLEKLSQAGIAVVVADRNVPLHLADVVLLDNEQAGYSAVKHLLELGHKRIACISGPSDLSPSRFRVEGYFRALKEKNITPDPSFVEKGDFTFNGGAEAMQLLLQNNPLPDAVFVLNDMMAIGAMTAIRNAGLRIPDDISIIGFDDIEIAAAIFPALTTMRQPAAEMAQLATNQLIEKMQHKGTNKNKHFSLQAELIIRDSTKKRDTSHE